MSTTMRAKLQVGHVQQFKGEDGKVVQENLIMHAVSKNQYDETGLDEDNTYARYSPTASFSISIMNPALFGMFEAGEKYYVDFTLAS